MFFAVLSVLAFFGAAQCTVDDVVKCLKDPVICAAEAANPADFKVLKDLGWDPKTCVLPVSTSDGGATDPCPIPSGSNTGIICTIPGSPTIPPSSPTTTCYYTNLQVTQPCDAVIAEFMAFATPADQDCEKRQPGGRRRRNAPRPGFDVSF